MKEKGKYIGTRGSLSSFLARHITALTSLRGRRVEGKRKGKYISARERDRLAFYNSHALFPLFLPLEMSAKLAMLKHSEVNKIVSFTPLKHSKYTLANDTSPGKELEPKIKEHQNRVLV